MSKSHGATRTSSSSAPKGIASPNGRGGGKIDTQNYIDNVFNAARTFVQQQRQIYNQIGTLTSETDVTAAATQLKAAFKSFDDANWQSHDDYVKAVKATGDRSGIQEFESERRRHEDYTQKSYDKTVKALLEKADTYGVKDKVRRIIVG